MNSDNCWLVYGTPDTKGEPLAWLHITGLYEFYWTTAEVSDTLVRTLRSKYPNGYFNSTYMWSNTNCCNHGSGYPKAKKEWLLDHGRPTLVLVK